MSRCPTFIFQISIMSKWLAKHISTKVSFKITTRKRQVYIYIRWTWKWNQYFYLGIWEDERSKIIFLPSFQLVTGLNSQNRNETSSLMNSDTLICIWILAFPSRIIQVSTPRKWMLLIYFSSFNDYWHPTTLISLVHNSLGEMEWCEKRAFQLLKMRKMKVILNIKTKCVTNILLTVRSSSMKDYTVITPWAQKTNVYINLNKINVNFEIFCLPVTGYLNTKESFPFCMFVVMASEKCEFHTYFTFLQRILTSKHMKKFNIFWNNICREVQHSLFRSR